MRSRNSMNRIDAEEDIAQIEDEDDHEERQVKE